MSVEPVIETPIQFTKSDARLPRGSWQPGNYVQSCRVCSERYFGGKRSSMCADCEYDLQPAWKGPSRE